MNQHTVTAAELVKIPYFSAEAVEKRSNVEILPYWDGERWHTWIPHDGRLITMHPHDAVESDYIGKSAQREEDLRIPFVEFMWQRGNFAHVRRHFRALCEDFHNLFASVAKLKVLHTMKGADAMRIPQSFVRTEVEYMLTVSRGIFDLLYETIREIWERTTLVETFGPPEKKLPDRFSKFLLEGNERKPRTAQVLVERFQVPPLFAAAIERHAEFFSGIRGLRDGIIHGIGSPPTFFVLDGGFGVSPTSMPFAHFPWQACHHYNDHVVSLLPWLADLVLRTIDACSDIMFAFASEIQFPDELAPGYHVFVRCQTSKVVLDLLAAHRNELVWWKIEPEAK
jgi:hypothetical protein